jgi:methylated-DNA-[protein]-cysteine S-methyltransferase
MLVYKTIIESSVGILTLIANDNALCGLSFGDVDYEDAVNKTNHPILMITKTQLKEYFSGKRSKFNIPLFLEGTEFQKKTWKALQLIPYGETRSYSDIAAKIKSPKAVRAIGSANNKNPIAIIIPCHRVIGKNGSLVGFAGGLDIKKTLLRHEGYYL